MRVIAWASLLTLLMVSAPPTVARGQGLLERLTGPRAAAHLRSEVPDERIEAARVLGRWGDARAAVRALTDALRTERDVTVRRAIVTALARRGHPSAVPGLVDALQTAQNLDPGSVVLALGAFDTDGASRALVAALGQDDVREAAVRALVRVGPDAVPHLLRAATEPALAPAAIRVLGVIGDRRATPLLVAQLGADREEVRLAAARALGAIGDRRAAPALVGALDDDSPRVQLAALVALGSTGDAGQAGLLAARVGRGGAAHRRAALASLLRIDPTSAIPLMEAAVADGDPVLGRPSVELALGSVHPRGVPLLFGLLREGTRAAEAAGALAEVEGGEGLGVLARVTAERSAPSDATARALAVGLRKWAETVPDDARERYLSVLRARPESPRSALLRAIALDPEVGAELEEMVRSDDPAVRAVGAYGIEVLGRAEHRDAVVHALVEEDDPEAYRRLAQAAVALRVSAPRSAVRGRLDDPEVAPEAMALAAASYAEQTPRWQRRLGEAFRRELRAEHPRARAGAARALALAGDSSAWRALAQALDDPAVEVRLASARALELLAVEASADAALARWRIEEDPAVAAALLDAADAARRRRIPAAELGVPAGRESVRVRIVAVAEEGRAGVPVDLLLPDGRWLRMRTLASGELVVVDLPAGAVDVRVRVGDS